MSVTQHDNLFLAHDKAICSGSLYTFFVEQEPGQPRRSATAVHNDLRHEIGEVLLLHKQCLCILSVPRRFPNKAFDVKSIAIYALSRLKKNDSVIHTLYFCAH